MNTDQQVASSAAPKRETPDLTGAAARSAWPWFLAICLLLAAILRFSFPQDIEYKGDERYMMIMLEQYRHSHMIPPIGMRSSAGVPNPGLSVWIFLFLGQVFHASTPVGLARGVAVLNMLALAVLFVTVRTVVPRAEREVWSWAAAIFSVNVYSMLFSRKIWAQCTAPLLTALLILAWFHRDRRLGAFFCGLLMALLGQIHMAGFFFAAALLLWGGVFERFRRHPRPMPWVFLGAGLFLGSLPLLPWLPYASIHSADASRTVYRYWYDWVRTSLGSGLDYSLGQVQLADFLRWPKIAGRPSYLVLALEAVIAGMIATLLGIMLRSRSLSLLRLLGAGTETAFLESAGLWGVGLLLTFLGFPLYPHYLLVLYPLPWLWIARLGAATGRKGRVGLALIWGAQLLVSVSFLLYIHAHHGAVYGDYGITYGYQ